MMPYCYRVAVGIAVIVTFTIAINCLTCWRIQRILQWEPIVNKLLLQHSVHSIYGNSYVVRFHENVNNISVHVNSLQLEYPEIQVRHIYHHMKAMAVANVSARHLKYIQSMLDVVDVEPDHIVEAMRVQNLSNTTFAWGIDRIDGEIDGKYHYKYTGKGVRVYIIDSGIQLNHHEFQSNNSSKKSRAKCGKNFRKDLDENCSDQWGHGTHVAALVGGKTYGVAKDAELIAVKVFGADGKSRFSDVVAALEYVIYRKFKEPNLRMVINLSLGTERKATLLNDAVEKAVKAGIPVVVAAGNGNSNACSYSPASASNAITVAASTIDDDRLSYSNWGRCVDLYAPGENIWSAWTGSRYAGSFQTGTSSAAPYVAGTVALYLQRSGNMTPNEIKDALQNDATVGVLKNKTRASKFLPFRIRRDTPNLLLNVGIFLKSP